MLFEFQQNTRKFRALLNGETPVEVVKILSALSYLTVKEPTIDVIEGERTVEGQLASGTDLEGVRTMVFSALDAIPAHERSAGNDSLEFTLR